jgi:precorrin-4/cobalt-precorrin-4 C11-methyltransferase
MDLDGIREVFRDAARRNLTVARLQTGDLSLYSAIGEQTRMLEELGIEYEMVPGVSSFQAAASQLKRELTVPEITQTVILTRMEGRTPVPERERIEELARHRCTMCVFLSVGMMKDLVRQLRAHYPKETPVAVVYRASWEDERIVRGNLADITGRVAEAGIRKTAMIVVGNALLDSKTFSKLYDGHFTHGYRE